MVANQKCMDSGDIVNRGDIRFFIEVHYVKYNFCFFIYIRRIDCYLLHTTITIFELTLPGSTQDVDFPVSG
jgi:hypothetical protein